VGAEADHDDCVLVGLVIDPPNAPGTGGVVGDLRLPNVIGVTLGPKTWMTRVGGELTERLSDAFGPFGVASKKLPCILDEVWVNRDARH
jgi:hypothetical protein